MSEPSVTPHGPNGQRPPPPADDQVAEELRRIEETAKGLLQPSPSALNATGHQTVVPLVNTPQQLETFRAHPTIRLTLQMACPKKGKLGARNYAIMPGAMPYLERAMIAPFTATLFPIMIASHPLSFKLILVKLPTGGRDWDNYNLTKKLVLDESVSAWRAMRSVAGGYAAYIPPDGWQPPKDAEFPDYSEAVWLHKSLGVTDLIVHDENHPMFKEISGANG